MTVVLAGGGTAGHIEPALNLADELGRIDPSMRVVALGTPKGLESRIVPARGYELAMIPPVPLPRRLSKELFTLPGRSIAAHRQTRAVLRTVGARVVVGFGGYVSFPAYLAARSCGIPIVVHEANAKAGLANRLGARLTAHVAENYEGSLPHAQRIGCPLRATIAQLDRRERRAEALEYFGLADRPTLLAFGGSQGAASINAAVREAAPAILGEGLQILHAVGRGKRSGASQPGGYAEVEYIDRMDLAYAAADLAVCRAGAMTCAELSAVGLPAIYVPYPVGNGEQRFNAAPIVDRGGGLLVLDQDLVGDRLSRHVRELFGDPRTLPRMGAAAAGYGIRDAAARLADMTLAAVS